VSTADAVTTNKLTTLSEKTKEKTKVTGGGNFNSAIQAGLSQTGTRYLTAGKTPGGFDCSGFVSWAFGQAGRTIPSSTAQLRSLGQKVSYSQAQPGDLIFFDTVGRDGHVGIY